jgi:hypothetical protein
VGIRRCRAPFILLTNPDIVFSDELIDYLGRRELDAECYYRTDRYDFRPEAIYAAPAEEIFDRASRAVFAVHSRWLTGGSAYYQIDDPAGEWIKSPPLEGDVQLEDGVHLTLNYVTPHWGMHLNAGGDFLLMSREAWDRTRGYCERPEYNSQLDGLVIAYARARGLKQVILNRPYCILHMDHGREERKTRPDVEDSVWAVHHEMDAAIHRHVFKMNDENWGMAGSAFTECQFGYKEGVKLLSQAQ